MKFALFVLALIPMAFAMTVPVEEDINEQFSLIDLVDRLKNLDLSQGCVKACEENVHQFWTFLCTAACKILFERTGAY